YSASRGRRVMGNGQKGKPFFTLCVPILQAFHGTTLSRNISITVPHNIEKRCISSPLENLREIAFVDSLHPDYSCSSVKNKTKYVATG
ncbi:hypothetical protein PJF56_15050, partial [Roseofilum sp. BLCC_M91]